MNNLMCMCVCVFVFVSISSGDHGGGQATNSKPGN